MQISSLLTKLQGLGEIPSPDAQAPVEPTDIQKHGLRIKPGSSVVHMEVVYWKVYNFWYTYGTRLQSGNGVGTSKYDLAQKMFQLHQDIVAVIDKLIIGQQSDSGSLDNLQRKIGDILSLQKQHITQFEFCLDEFNRYLVSLGRLESFLQHRG